VNWGGLRSIVNRPEATMSTKTTKATNKTRASALGRTATKLAATLTNGPALLGYARVSTSDQDTSIQHAKLRDAGCTVIEPRRRLARPETAATSLRPS
jgi:hypothetical protein